MGRESALKLLDGRQKEAFSKSYVALAVNWIFHYSSIEFLCQEV